MGTFYHTTNYNPLTGDLNNMTKIQNYVVDKNGNGTIKEVKVAKGNPGKGTKGYQYGEKGPGGGNDPSNQNLPPVRKWKA